MKEKLTYICVTPFFPNKQDVYGAYILDQVKAIQRSSSYQVVVLKPQSKSREVGSYVYDGIRVFEFPSFFMPSYFFNGITNRYNKRRFLNSLRKIEVDPFNIAVVHCHTASFACFGLAIKEMNSDTKVLVQYHDKDPYQVLYGKFASFLPNLLYRSWVSMRNLRNVDYHICISRVVEDNLLSFPHPGKYENYRPYIDHLRKIQWIKNDTSNFKTVILHNGVDTNIFRPSGNSKPEDVFRIGCIGNFIELKDQLTLLRACKLIVKDGTIPNLQVELIGHGPMEDVLKQYVIENNLSNVVNFHSEVHHAQLPEFYNSLDLFVLPSVFEGLGCVYLEAAACGVPFIMCSGQGAIDFIDDSEWAKWLITPHDYKMLANLIMDFYDKRYEQTLVSSFVIDDLVKTFIEKISE